MLKPEKAPRIALRTSVLYVLLGGLWILGSDHALVAIIGHAETLVQYEVYKGWAFVLVTGLLLYVGLRAQFRRYAVATDAQARAENELSSHRERLHLAAVAGNIGFWDIDVSNNHAYFSPEWKQHLGYTETELPNRVEEWQARIHPEERERIRRALSEYIANPSGLYRQEYRLKHRDGSYRWILSQGSMKFDGRGNPIRMLGAHIDITTIKEAEAALRERADIHARLAHIAAVVPGAIISYQETADGRRSFPYASPAILDVFGLAPGDVVNDAMPVLQRIHPEDAVRVRAAIEESARNLTPWRCEYRFNHPTKGEVWIEGFSLPETSTEGRLLWNGFVMDITARKRAELRVHQLNRVYAVLSDINQTIIRVREPQLLFDAVCRIAVDKGHFRMAWIGRVDEAQASVVPVSSAGVVDGYLDEIDLSLPSGAANLPVQQALATGSHVVCNDVEHEPASAPWRDAALARGYRAMAVMPFRMRGTIVGALNLYATESEVFDDPEIQLLDEMAIDLSFALEISEGEAGRLRTEASSRENEERFRQLAENIREIFWLMDPVTRRMLYVSPVYETVSGYSVDSLYANPQQWYEIIHPDDRARVIGAIFSRQDAGTYDEEYRITRLDGTVRWIRARAFPVHDASGNVYRIAGVSEDITDRKQLEEQFFRAQRLEAIGTLASGIAHDLNNVLAPIMMCAPMLRMGLPPAECEKMLATIEASTRRGADLVRQLLVFGRGVEGGRGPVAPKALAGEMLKIASETFPKHIVVRSGVGDGLWDMVGDATQLHQVLLNLCVNARDAMPDGGELWVAAENVELDAKAAAAFPNARPGPYVRLSVRDSGTGIAPENIGKIFDPFFTTKPPGKGTGLGLSTVLGIVKSHGGFVQLESDVGRGSRFDVYIPAQLRCAAENAEGGVTVAPRGNGELILLVEDEVSIREVVADILLRQNYRVMTAEDGVEGETLFRENCEDIALVVTDLDMPRKDGVKLIEAVRRIRREVPVVVSTGLRSGRPTSERTTQLEDLEVAAVLAKPFGAHDILTAVHSALGKRTAK